MKKPFKSTKVFIPLIALLSSVMCFSIGFGAWNMTGGMSLSLYGDIDSDDIGTDSKGIKVIDYTSKPTFSFAAGYGFLNSSDEYVNNATLNWTASINTNACKDDGLIKSMKESTPTMSMITSLSISNTASLISGFSITNLTITGLGTPSVVQVNSKDTYVENNAIKEKINLTNVPLSDSALFSVSIAITYTGTTSNFPDLATNKLTLTLLAGEYITQ